MQIINNIEIGENFLMMNAFHFPKDKGGTFPAGLKFHVEKIILPHLDFELLTINIAGWVPFSYHAMAIDEDRTIIFKRTISALTHFCFTLIDVKDPCIFKMMFAGQLERME